MCEQKKTALALGFFDGLHIAHTAVLSSVLAQKTRGLTPAVLLFDRHPAEVLFNVPVPGLLTPEDRDALLAEMGLESVTLPFGALKDLSPRRFAEEILVRRFGCAFVSCGYNYRFGKNGEGDASLLAALGEACGFAVSVCGRVCLNGQPVSSTAIRRAVAAGDMQTAASMLGRPFGFTAPVAGGDGRGRNLGSPTVNQAIPAGLQHPKSGVYASAVMLEGKKYAAVTDIGVRPTFGGGEERCETFILDYSGDLYGERVSLGLLKYLRPERAFPSAGALSAQIAQDALSAREICARSPYFEDR